MKLFIKRSMLFVLSISCFVLLLSHTTYAQEESSIGYSYKIIKPENQVSSSGYFDLRMNPGQKQTVEIELYNLTDEEFSVDLSVASAKTNSNGVIEYGPTELENDPSLKYDVKDLVQVPETVVLAPKATVTVPVKITMPEEEYEGYLSGGIYLQRSETEAEKTANEKAKGVVNKYAFIVGLLLSESDVNLEPDLKFNHIQPGLTNYRNAFLLNFSNIVPNYVEEMTINAQIFAKGSDEVLYDTKKEGYRMAPNSMISFPINLNGESFTAGDYTGHILVTSGDLQWEWQEDFAVTQKEADKYNAEDVTLIQDRGINWLLIVLIAGGILSALLLVYLAVRILSKRKKQKKQTQKKQGLKRKKEKQKKKKL